MSTLFRGLWGGVPTVTHLQDEAEISGRLVFALEVLAVVDVEVVELDEADQIARRLERSRGSGVGHSAISEIRLRVAVTSDLALSLGHVVNSRRPQLEESLFP